MVVGGLDSYFGGKGGAVCQFVTINKDTVIAVIGSSNERKGINAYVRQKFLFLYNFQFPKARHNLVKIDRSLFTAEHSVSFNTGCWNVSAGIPSGTLLACSPSPKPIPITCLAPNFAGRWIATAVDLVSRRFQSRDELAACSVVVAQQIYSEAQTLSRWSTWHLLISLQIHTVRS